MKANSDTPIYLQLRDALAEQISAKGIAVGEKLKSERQLAEEMGVARMTVRKALLLMEGEGIIFRKDRSGYYVSPSRLITDPLNHKNTFKLFAEAGHAAHAETSKVVPYPATHSLAKLFGTQPGEPLLFSESISFMDGRKVVYDYDYFLASAFPGMEEMESYEPLTDFLRNEFGFVPKQTGFRARSTNLLDPVADALGVTNGTPGLFITRLTSHNHMVVYVNRSFWLADMLDIVVGDYPA